MQNASWRKAVEASADPQRAKHYLELLEATDAKPRLRKAKLEEARILCALLSGSQASAELIVAHPDWIGQLLEPDALSQPRRKEGLERELAGVIATASAASDYSTAFG